MTPCKRCAATAADVATYKAAYEVWRSTVAAIDADADATAKLRHTCQQRRGA